LLAVKLPAVRSLVLLWLLAGAAHAVEVEVDAETIGQGYQLRSGSDAIVNRRRLTQYLGLGVYGIGPSDSLGRPLPKNQFYLVLSMRVDAELADYALLRELSGRTPQHEVLPTELDLLYAYLGGRDLFGFLDFKLGRQVMYDLYNYIAFDGLSIEARTPFYVALEAWGGLSESGLSIFDQSIYRTDGVALGGNTIGSLAARQEEAYLPTVGFAVKSWGSSYFQTRLSYSRTFSSTVNPQPGEPSSGVNDEKVSWTVRGRFLNGQLIPWFGFRYNLLAGLVDEIQGGLRGQWGQNLRQSVQAEYVLSAPTFDGDSIWNVFGGLAFNDVRVTYDLAWRRTHFFARAFGRLFQNEVTSQGVSPYTEGSVAWGGALGGRVDFSIAHLRLDGYYEDGSGGLIVGVDLSGQVRFFGEGHKGLGAEGRVSYVHFRDQIQALLQADSLGVQAGLRYGFSEGLTLHALIEENINRFFSSQFRALVMLDISFWVGPRGHGWARPRAGVL
jgi:hypothetical protein